MKKTFFPSLLIALGVFTAAQCFAFDATVQPLYGFNTYEICNTGSDTLTMESLVIETTLPSGIVHTYVQTSSVTIRHIGKTGTSIRHHEILAPGEKRTVSFILGTASAGNPVRILVLMKDQQGTLHQYQCSTCP
jgi:hypothetical protein